MKLSVAKIRTIYISLDMLTAQFPYLSGLSRDQIRQISQDLKREVEGLNPTDESLPWIELTHSEPVMFEKSPHVWSLYRWNPPEFKPDLVIIRETAWDFYSRIVKLQIPLPVEFLAWAFIARKGQKILYQDEKSQGWEVRIE